MSLKVTTWNIEHTSRLLNQNPSPEILDRRARVLSTLNEIDPDVLLIVEGPKGEQQIIDFCQTVFNNQWVPVLLDGAGAPVGSRDRDYGHDMRGTQWMWYVVKPGLANNCRIQPAVDWHNITSDRWEVNYWGQIDPEFHDHYRMPQVMLYTLPGGMEIEFIGVHLKSPINRERITRNANGNLTGAYLESALKSRVKLATEARDIRRYIEAKYVNHIHPGIVILGDCNDGPGHDFFETRYLFFDLIQNLQGEVLLAERFFNHVLFDFPADRRWTARFRDAILGIPASQNPLLIDHILVSQGLVNGSHSLQVNAGNGLVEHRAFDRGNLGSNNDTRTSDHRPVSVIMDGNA